MRTLRLTRRPIVIVSPETEAQIRASATVGRKLAREVVVHIVVEQARAGSAVLWMRVDHADAQFVVREAELSSQNVSGIELYNPASFVEVTDTRLKHLHKSYVEAPRSGPVAESEKAAPFSVRITPEDKRLQSAPITCRDSEDTGFTGIDRFERHGLVVGTVEPAQDFVEIRVQPMFVLVPRCSPAAVVRMVAHKLPAKAIGDHDALRGACDPTEQR